MLILTNSTSLTLGPNQSATFDTVLLHTGCAECFRPGSGTVMLTARNAIYDIFAGGNIGATEVGNANLTVFLNSSPMTETSMNSATAAVGDTNSVSRETGVRTCCCGNVSEAVTLRNNGETTIVLENPILKIRRAA